MTKLMYRRLGTVLKTHRKLVLHRHENGLEQVRDGDQEKRLKLLGELKAMLDSVDERLDVDAEEVDRFLYYCFRNCPPADVLLLNETLYEDALEKRLKASENDLGELGLELLAKLHAIVQIQYEAEEGKADLWVRKVEE
ncbi:hypothetical protein Rhal01_02197 [Rubritalea halochordaticola]|uniref:Uncharacterized protein n=2 Tax=Rubritalea halochordaticola TaxID=714537 RepID=A0ABP9UZZ7_9BACT